MAMKHHSKHVHYNKGDLCGKGSHLSKLLGAVDAERMSCQLMGCALHLVKLLLTNKQTDRHIYTHTRT